jgi:DNA-binding transcriptional ArsR family regulator
MASADLLLHPVRLRIVKAFLDGRQLTTSAVAGELEDVPAASVYRHIALLARAGVLDVVSERRVRGAVERTYALHLATARIDPAEVARMSPQEHGQAFMAYVAGMLADADRYLASGQIDPIRDGADYRAGALWLTNEEFAAFVQDLAAIVQPRLALGPGEGRHRRLLYGVVLPDRSKAVEPRPGAPSQPQQVEHERKDRDGAGTAGDSP